jgi:hypothetical protein
MLGQLLGALFLHHSEIVLGVLVEVLGFHDITLSRSILRHGGVALIVVASVLRRVTALTGGTNARWSLVHQSRALRPRTATAPV